MKPLLFTGIGILAMLTPASFAQQSTQAAAQPHAHAQSAQSIDVADAAAPAAKVVDAFSAALAKGEFSEVERMLDPQVLILESGGAEHSRAEYLGHHAKADAKFLAGAHISLLRRTGRAQGDLAWVASEREMHVTREGKPATLRSTETMVLRRTADGWRIAHIHWSSKTKAST